MPSFTLTTNEVLASNQKHIHRRKLAGEAPAALPVLWHDIILGAGLQEWLRNVDTLFIATYNRKDGLDAWVQSGRPGFVRAADNRTLLFPNFPGGHIVNEAGNLACDPRTGLLFLNFEHGSTLQVTGCMQAISDPGWVVQFDGACAVVEFSLDEVIYTERATTLRWRLLSYSS